MWPAPLPLLEVSQSGGGGQKGRGGLLEHQMHEDETQGAAPGLQGPQLWSPLPPGPAPGPPTSGCVCHPCWTAVWVGVEAETMAQASSVLVFAGWKTTLRVMPQKKPLGWFGGFLICKTEVTETIS